MIKILKSRNPLTFSWSKNFIVNRFGALIRVKNKKIIKNKPILRSNIKIVFSFDTNLSRSSSKAS